MEDKNKLPILDDMSKENISLIENQMEAEYSKQLKRQGYMRSKDKYQILSKDDYRDYEDDREIIYPEIDNMTNEELREDIWCGINITY